MKVDAPLIAATLDEVPDAARAAEAAGYDGLYTFEGPHDPFFPLVLAAEHTERVELMTAIAIAFARNPTTLAHLGWDLQTLSQGRAVLGLGSQVRAHITKRFSMPWSHPAPRMRELVLAIRSIWTAWQDGIPLRFEGQFYRHTLMTPLFSPDPMAHGTARVFVAGVGPLMTEVAGEVADGFLVHPFSSVRYLTDVTGPALERGLARSGRSRAQLEVAFPVMVASGATDQACEEATEAVRSQIAFYASTPAYRPVLEVHGWADLQPELHRLTREGRWEEMAGLVDDELVDTFAVRGDPGAVAGMIRDRYASLVDRVAFNAPYRPDPAAWATLIDALRAP